VSSFSEDPKLIMFNLRLYGFFLLAFGGYAPFWSRLAPVVFCTAPAVLARGCSVLFFSKFFPHRPGCDLFAAFDPHVFLTFGSNNFFPPFLKLFSTVIAAFAALILGSTFFPLGYHCLLWLLGEFRNYEGGLNPPCTLKGLTFLNANQGCFNPVGSGVRHPFTQTAPDRAFFSLYSPPYTSFLSPRPKVTTLIY